MNKLPYWSDSLRDIPDDECILVNPFDVKNLRVYEWEDAGLGLYASLPTKFKRICYTHWTGHEFQKGEVMSPQCFQIMGEDSLGLCVNPKHIKLVKYETRQKHIQRDINRRIYLDKKRKRKGKKVGDWSEEYAHPMAKLMLNEYKEHQTELCPCPCHTCKCKCPKEGK